VLTAHHIAIAGWSLELVLDALSECYRARLTGGPGEPAPASRAAESSVPAGLFGGDSSEPGDRFAGGRGDLLRVDRGPWSSGGGARALKGREAGSNGVPCCSERWSGIVIRQVH